MTASSSFKWTPPGRGLWMMGTDYVYQRGGAALNNCFIADTKIITEQGAKPIGNLAGTTVRVLTQGNRWVEAPVRSFGEQKVWKLTLRRQGIIKEIFTTEDHGWFATDRRAEHRNKGHVRFKTSELRPEVHKLQSIYGQGIKNIRPSSVGIAQGIVYGDGTTTPGERHSNHLYLVGDRNKPLAKYFGDACITEAPEKDALRVADLPNYYRDLPSIHETSSFLYGWLAGYFAADGTVKEDGAARLSSANREALEFVRDVGYRLGIGTYGIRERRVYRI